MQNKNNYLSIQIEKLNSETSIIQILQQKDRASMIAICWNEDFNKLKIFSSCYPEIQNNNSSISMKTKNGYIEYNKAFFVRGSFIEKDNKILCVKNDICKEIKEVLKKLRR